MPVSISTYAINKTGGFPFPFVFLFQDNSKNSRKKIRRNQKITFICTVTAAFFYLLEFFGVESALRKRYVSLVFFIKKKFILCLPPIMCKKCLIPPKLLMYSKIKAEINFHKETMSPDFLSLFFLSKHSVWWSIYTLFLSQSTLSGKPFLPYFWVKALYCIWKTISTLFWSQSTLSGKPFLHYFCVKALIW